MSMLGIETPTDVEEFEYSSRLKIRGMETTDSMGQVICQSALSLELKDDEGRHLKSLELSLRLTPDTIEPIFSGTTWAGTVLWRAAVRLIDVGLLSERRPFELDASTSVVELGCGLGVPGMVAAQLGAGLVALTEQGNLVELIERNARANFGDESTSVVRARELDWSADAGRALCDQLNQGRPFDVVLCCDCVYIPLYGDSYKLLVQAVHAVSGPRSHVLVSVERRHVAGATDGVDLFLDGMAAAGFKASPLPSEPPVEIYYFRKQ